MAPSDRFEQVVHPASDDWQARYRATTQALNDVARLVSLHRLVSSVDLQAPPTVSLLAGELAVRSARRVGLLTGSFNPLTLAHLALAEAARVAARLDVVVWASAVVTVDKERVSRATLPDRLAQMQVYTNSIPGNALAIFNHGLYMEEATALRARLAPGADLVILVGFDKIVQIFDPAYYTDREAALHALFEAAEIMVAPRADARAPELERLLSRPENRPYASRISYVDVPAQLARESSTEARALAAKGHAADRELEELLPPEGSALVHETGAYTPQDTRREQDRYIWRERWLRAFEAAAPPAIEQTPSLTALVSRAIADDPLGQIVRRWLDGERWPGGPASVDDLLWLLRER